MKKLQQWWGAATLSAVLTISASAQDPISTYSQTIQMSDLEKHLRYIASDELEGRDTGSEGAKKAAEYIAKHFETLGLKPIVPSSQGPSYYQPFTLYKKGWKMAYVQVGNHKKTFFQDFYPNGLVNVPTAKDLPIAFIGHGLPGTYANQDVKGKAVVFFEADPKNSEEWTGNAGLKKKVEAAKEAGAVCFFEISASDAQSFKTKTAERKAILNRYNRMVFDPKAEPETASPTFVVSQEMAAEMLGISPKKWASWKENPQLKKAPAPIRIQIQRGDEEVKTMNVLGFMEGTDKKDEVIVLTAHYDHVGVDAKGEIYNGADDDGSGTCAILELAEAFAKAKATGNGPRRSLLFMTVTGEEKGLLGSQYYTDVQPIIPLSQTVCNFNIDMIGRVDKAHEKDPNYVYIIGSDKLSSELHAISEEANSKSVNFVLDYTFNDPKDPNRFYYRSDHYNFAKNKIPVAFYFTGVHEDYHRPGDDVEKIMFPKYEKIVRLVFYTAWEVANRDERIKVDSNKP